MFARGDERFDLFFKKVFMLSLPENINARFDFISKKQIIIFTPPKEYLIMMKIVTNRDRDIDDILTICRIEKEINWDLVIDTILENADSDWIYLDLEETLKKISQEFFIKKKYFDKIYASFGKSANNT